MIKGVNRHIIEVTDPEPACFDRVILFLHAEGNRTPSFLHDQTDRYLASLASSYRRSRILKQRIIFFAAITFSAVLGGIISYFIFIG